MAVKNAIFLITSLRVKKNTARCWFWPGSSEPGPNMIRNSHVTETSDAISTAVQIAYKKKVWVYYRLFFFLTISLLAPPSFWWRINTFLEVVLAVSPSHHSHWLLLMKTSVTLVDSLFQSYRTDYGSSSTSPHQAKVNSETYWRTNSDVEQRRENYHFFFKLSLNHQKLLPLTKLYKTLTKGAVVILGTLQCLAMADYKLRGLNKCKSNPNIKEPKNTIINILLWLNCEELNMSVAAQVTWCKDTLHRFDFNLDLMSLFHFFLTYSEIILFYHLTAPAWLYLLIFHVSFISSLNI